MEAPISTDHSTADGRAAGHAELVRDSRLSGKVAIVTGAGSRGEGIGNGRAAAILMARSGARVMLLDAVGDWVARTAEMIAEEGGACAQYVGDVTRPQDCQAVVAEAVEKWGRLDILVNNVGIDGPFGTALDVDPDAWAQAMSVNVTSMMLMAKFAVPEMQKSGGGAIVNLASGAGLIGGHPALLYPTSKGAVVNMTRAMAAHHGTAGIRVNCVAPGSVYTPMVSAKGMDEATRTARRNKNLLKTEGTGWDVGNAVRFLASDEARWITGVILSVDGGAMAGLPILEAAPQGGFQK
jgi:NAD(P)-dependent dehydrogenase (short-subunit alcohol dehydrogenase family)